MIRPGAWALIILMLAFAASPFPVSALPTGTTMMPMQESGQSSAQSSGCNCNMPMHATAAMPGTTTIPRQAGGTDPAPFSGSAIPGLPGATNSSGRFSGIRWIYPKNVLDHPERAAVYAAIVARPGIDIAGIASELGMNRETLRYHLGLLESTVKIVVMRDRGIVRYYENHGRYTPFERKVLQHLWNPTGKQILALIAGQPGITQTELSARLAVTAPTVRWYMQRFCADGIVTGQHEGKYTRYMLVPGAGGFVPGAAVGAPALL